MTTAASLDEPAGDGRGPRDGVRRVLGSDGSVVGPAPALSREDRLAIHRAMLLSRRVDDVASALCREGEIGFFVSARGLEAAQIGAAWALGDNDWLFPSYRDHGAALCRGMPLKSYFDNLFGNGDDIVKGRQLASHFSYKRARIANVGTLNGSHIGVGVGFAWAARLRGERSAVLISFGDEGTSSNDFHNGMNFAGVFGAPAVLLCVNDLQPDQVPGSAVERLADKGDSYGVRAVRCDGGDVLAVLATVREALERAGRGEGPTFVEAVATDGDARDPLLRWRAHLVREIGWDDAREAALATEIDANVDAAVKGARSLAPPPVASLFDDVFAELPWHLREQRDELMKGR